MKDQMRYSGYRRVGEPVVIRRPSGEELRPDRSQMLEHHSDEFEWGYNGSGPAQLALALLLDYFNSEEVALAHHQAFKREVLADFNDSGEWRLKGAEIEEFVENLEDEQDVAPGVSREMKRSAEPV